MADFFKGNRALLVSDGPAPSIRLDSPEAQAAAARLRAQGITPTAERIAEEMANPPADALQRPVQAQPVPAPAVRGGPSSGIVDQLERRQAQPLEDERARQEREFREQQRRAREKQQQRQRPVGPGVKPIGLDTTAAPVAEDTMLPALYAGRKQDTYLDAVQERLGGMLGGALDWLGGVRSRGVELQPGAYGYDQPPGFPSKAASIERMERAQRQTAEEAKVAAFMQDLSPELRWEYLKWLERQAASSRMPNYPNPGEWY